MRRVHRLRRHQRENVLVVVFANRFALVRGKAVEGTQTDSILLELSQDLRAQLALALLLLAHDRVAFGYLLLRSAPIDGKFLHSGYHLLLQAADALHEE